MSSMDVIWQLDKSKLKVKQNTKDLFFTNQLLYRDLFCILANPYIFKYIIVYKIVRKKEEKLESHLVSYILFGIKQGRSFCEKLFIHIPISIVNNVLYM